jgi:hypothetical protein
VSRFLADYLDISFSEFVRRGVREYAIKVANENNIRLSTVTRSLIKRYVSIEISSENDKPILKRYVFVDIEK